MTSTIINAWPGRPELAWRRPGLPREWVLVLDRNPNATLNPDPLPGYVWLDTRGKLLHAPQDALKFREGEM
jgi:hypothetical protein